MKEPTFITKHRLTQAALKDGNCVFVKKDSMVFGFLEKDEQGGIKFNRWEFPFLEGSPYFQQAAGPCNGIFIINDGIDQLFLWNPATREYKALPPSLEMLLSDRISSVGFGIDPNSKDYKVVRLWHFGRSDDDEFISKVEVMCLSATDLCRPKSETWKIIDAVPSIRSVIESSEQIYANGKYYWFNEPLMFDEQYNIVWFDMGAEVFGLIHVPKLFSFLYNRIAVVNGSPAVIRPAYIVEENKTKSMYEIWIIDDYPWTKYATIGPLPKYQTPFGFWNDKEVFVLGISERDPVTYKIIHQVFSYDIKTNAIKKKWEGVALHMCYLSNVGMYSESLISFTG